MSKLKVLFYILIGVMPVYGRAGTNRNLCLLEGLLSATSKTFKNSSIKHPKYYLWDNWGFKERGKIHVYSMAADRSLAPDDRHLQAHWRHFVSVDNGKTWVDQGPVLKARGSGHDGQAIWSGSIFKQDDGTYLAAYTGIDPENTYLQSISFALAKDPHNFKRLQPKRPFMSHVHDREKFVQAGYYVDEIGQVGKASGEVDGAIQALRDPFVLTDEQGLMHMYWGAKSYDESGKVVSSIGHAIIEDIHSPGAFKLMPAIVPEDAKTFNQVELPNVVKGEDGKFYWIVSTTNRKSQAQAEAEIEMRVRRYVSDSLDGPIRVEGTDSVVENSDETRKYAGNIVRNFDQPTTAADDIELRTFNIDDYSIE